MKKFLLSATSAAALFGAGTAHADCGDISIAVFSWQAAEAHAYVDQFILNNGYGCNVALVAGDTVPTIASMVEKGQPELVPEGNPGAMGAVYASGLAEERIVPIGTGITEGSESGWYIPQYLADAHPEIKTVEDAVAHPELFPAPEDASKGGVIQGPQGWGDTVVTAQLYKALDLDNKGFTLVPSGSAAALDGAITKAYEQKQGFIAAYWAPTSLLAQYPMQRLSMAHDPEEWTRCTTVQDCPDPKPNYWQSSPELTVATKAFADRTDIPEVKDYLSKHAWTQAEVGALMVWMTENQANGEDAAKWFIQNKPEVWTKWVPADVAEKVKAAAQ